MLSPAASKVVAATCSSAGCGDGDGDSPGFSGSAIVRGDGSGVRQMRITDGNNERDVHGDGF